MMIVMKQKMLMVGSSVFNLRYVFSPICRVKAAENMLLLTMLEMALAGLPTVAPPPSIVSLPTKRVQFHLNLGEAAPLVYSPGLHPTAVAVAVAVAVLAVAASVGRSSISWPSQQASRDKISCFHELSTGVSAVPAQALGQVRELKG